MTEFPGLPILPRLLTKLNVPRFKKTMLARDRLIEMLRKTDHVKLVTISAPAGYGKTVLLADYANRNYRPCSWLSFDSTDTDPTVFIESLVLSIRQTFPQFARASEFVPGLVAAMREPQRGSEVCVRQLVNEMYVSIKENFDLILDDYHVVENQPQVDRLVNTLLLYLPENCRILLSCRTIPSLDLTSLLIQGDVTGLGVSELKMTPDEVYAMLAKNYNLPFSREEAVELAEKTEGWVTGIMLAGDKFIGRLEGPPSFTSPTQLFDYLSTQILANLPGKLQTFLLESSVPEVLTVEGCGELLEIDDAAVLLWECEHRRLFINQVQAGQGRGKAPSYYRYHNLFRNFLLNRLQETRPARSLYLYRRSADLFIKQGDPETAMTYLLQSEAYQAALDLLKKVGEKELQTGRNATLQGWFEALPETLFWMEPDVVMLKVKLLGSSGNFEEAHSLLNQLEARLNIQTPAPLLTQAQVQLIRAKLFRTQVLYEQAIQVLQKALQGLAYYSELPPEAQAQAAPSPLENPPENQAENLPTPALAYRKAEAEVYLELGVNMGMSGQLKAALAMLEKARPLFETLDSQESLARLHQCFSAVYSGLGDTGAARKHLEMGLDCWESIGNLTGVVNTLVNLGSVGLGEGDYTQAEIALNKALAVAVQAGYLAGQAYALAFMGDLSRDTGRFEQARKYYEQSSQLAESSNEKRLILLVRREIAANLRRLGDYPGAEQALREAYRQLPEAQRNQGYYLELLRLIETGIALDQANYPQARLLLDKGADFFQRKENKRELAVRLFLEARLNFGLGKVRASLANLTDALALAQQIGHPAGVLKQEAWYARPFLQFARTYQGKLSQFQPAIEALLGEPPALTLEAAPAAAAPELAPETAPAALALEAAPRRIAPAQPQPPLSPEAPAPPAPAKTAAACVLEGFSLGKPEVRLQGVVVQDWRTIKAVELLFLFMDQGRSLRKEFIINALWPDVESSKTENLFKTTLYRLRQALFPDWFARDGAAYRLNVAYWYDAAEFQKLIRQGDHYLLANATDAQKKQLALESYRAAAALYRGDFLEGLYSDWCIERQQQLEMLYHELLIKLAQLHFQMADYETALATVEKYLQFDPFSETAHLIRLEIYKKLGNTAMLSHSYQLYTQMLKELNQEPSPEVKFLFKS
jgi:ATP/maltotriose-dependent transcriptional regulator MalT/DNA-binding SARP family transcriptional activator